MKILKKALISLSIILFNTTKAYATTAETYVAETGSGIGKFFLFLVAIGLVALVLFIGYKMDKNEAQEKRKEKIRKQRDDDVYSKIYTSYDNKKTEVEDEEEVEELPEINFAPKTEEYFKNSLNESTQKIDIVNEKEIDTYNSLKPDVQKVEEKIVYEEVEEDGYTEEEDVYESEDFGETQVIFNEEDSNDEDEETFNSTMVFNSSPINNLNIDMDVEEKITNKISDVKGYDYEDDDSELLDLEQAIAEANIKKYTRDKNQEMIKAKRVPKKKEEKKETKKESSSEKKYTRKKADKKESKKTKEEVKSTTKKYKAKKDSTKTKKTESKKTETKKSESKKEEPKSKAKKYTKVKEKKIEEVEVEKPKRGRKPSTKK